MGGVGDAQFIVVEGEEGVLGNHGCDVVVSRDGLDERDGEVGVFVASEEEILEMAPDVGDGLLALLRWGGGP